MASTVFKNFDLKITPTNEDDLYEVSVSSDCGEDVKETFRLSDLAGEVSQGNERLTTSSATELPFSEPSEIERISLVDSTPPYFKEASSLGRRLFKTVWKGDIRLALDRCLNTKGDAQLRIRLNLTSVPNLASLPWEFLCLEPENTFFAQSYNSIVRYLELTRPYNDSLLREPPLRILLVVSNPQGTTTLDVAAEVEKFKAAVAKLEAKGLVELDVLDRPTSKAIRVRLQDGRRSDAPYHVFHFMGHTVFDHDEQVGKLVLENESGRASYVSAQELGEVLSRFSSLRLVVLNACEGARTSPTDTYSGVAQTFLRRGAAPTVIAMQYKISDDAAKIFSQTFYEELMNGEDIDSAVALSRMAISDIETEAKLFDDDPVEWATPVLYMRANDSRLVDFSSNEVATDETLLRAKAQVTSRPNDHYGKVIEKLQAGTLVPFLGLDINLFDPSVALRPPAYAELVQHLTTFGSYPHRCGAPLAGVSQYAQLPDRLTELYDQLSPLFANEQYRPSKLHKFWARVAGEQSKRTDLDPKRRRFVIVTVNYDELLERAFAKHVEQFHVLSYIAEGDDLERGKFFRILYKNGVPDDPFVADASGKELSDESPVILKLPGSIKSFNAQVRLAITDDQYYALLMNRDLNNILPSSVMNKLRGSHHLFFGYNISDWNTRGMLYRIWNKQEPPKRSWAIQQQPSEFERRYWEACGVRVIDQDLASYIDTIYERLRQAQVPANAAQPTTGGLNATLPGNISQTSAPAAHVDQRTLYLAMIQAFNLEELELLCMDVEANLRNDNNAELVNLEIVGGSSKTAIILNLIQHMERRKLLPYLVKAVLSARPGLV